MGIAQVLDMEMTQAFGYLPLDRNSVNIKISRGMVLLWIIFWSMLMVYLIYRTPRDVGAISKKMSDLANLVKLENGMVLSEDKFVKPGAVVQMTLRFSAAGWSTDVKARNERIFESTGAVDISMPGKNIFCRGREQYEIKSPENNGFATYSIFMEYPGSVCHQ